MSNISPQIHFHPQPNRLVEETYRYIINASDVLDALSKYTVASIFQVPMDFDKSIIPKGTKLYRIRRWNPKEDFSQQNAWTSAPSKPQGRCNRQGQEALYLCSRPELCLLETHIQHNEKYVLGIYECTEDIMLGGFLNGITSPAHDIVCHILNAFLIAPARGENNRELFEYLDKHYGPLTINDAKYEHDLELPFRIGVINQRETYYNITNALCDTITQKYPQGIRFSSCFIPLETSGIRSDAYNVVLYQHGIPSIKFVKSRVITHDMYKFIKTPFTSTEIVKAFLSTTPNTTKP